MVGLLASGAALAGLYFVWMPAHATALAAMVGIGRGSDLILYTWVVISLLMMLNLHIKLRVQMDMITRLARNTAIEHAKAAGHTGDPTQKRGIRLRRKTEPARRRDTEVPGRSALTAK